jgi:hypothetical protein
MKYSQWSLMLDCLSQRRWYQFSVKVMLMAIAVAALPSWRIGYLSKMAAGHEASAERLAGELARMQATEHAPVWEKCLLPEASLALARQRISDVASQSGPTFKEIGNRKRGLCLHIGSEIVSLAYDCDDPEEFWLSAIHETRLAMIYRKAMWRPWSTVNEPPRPKVEYVVITGPFSGRISSLPVGDY